MKYVQYQVASSHLDSIHFSYIPHVNVAVSLWLFRPKGMAELVEHPCAFWGIEESELCELEPGSSQTNQ